MKNELKPIASHGEFLTLPPFPTIWKHKSNEQLSNIQQRQPVTHVPDLKQAHNSVEGLNMFSEIFNPTPVPLSLAQEINKLH